MPAPALPLVQPRIKTRALLLIAQLDRERSVLAAADTIGMSQPAASKLLRELEDDLGVRLFERHARGVVPTEFGEVLVRHAHSVLSGIRHAQEELAALKAAGRYRVAIGTVMSPGSEMVPTAISLLAERHPQLMASVEIDTSRPMLAKLLDGRLDIVIGRILDPEHASLLRFEALAEEDHRLIGRVRHPLARRGQLLIEDLVDQTWILPPSDSILRERLNAVFLQKGLQTPARVIESSSLPMITNLLRRTDMLVALPEEVVRPYCQAGMLQILDIDLKLRMDSFGIITRRDHPLSRSAAEALQVLREVAQAVYWQHRPG
jgi:DNA-binding transcriptional LysR family regulator